MEIFKDIKDFDYQISNFGRLRSKIRNQIMSVGKRMSNSGYILVRLYKDHKYYYRYIHRLLAETFIDNPNNYRTVNHIDGNKLNNDLSNLEWMSDSQQQRHAFLKSLKPSGNSFTDEQLYRIYDMFFIDKKKPIEIANILSRPLGTIKKICYGERCKDSLREYRDKVNL